MASMNRTEVDADGQTEAQAGADVSGCTVLLSAAGFDTLILGRGPMRRLGLALGVTSCCSQIGARRQAQAGADRRKLDSRASSESRRPCTRTSSRSSATF